MTILKFEVKKMLCSKTSIAAIGFLILLMAGLCIGYIWGGYYVQEDGSKIRGIKAAVKMQEAKEPWKGMVTEEVVARVIKENNKSWSNVKFLQVITELAGRNNLGIESHDIENRTIPFLEQENISDIQFISERCELEGCAFVIYDGKIVLYSPEAIEKSNPVKTITVKDDTNYKYDDNSMNAYGACEVDNGSISGFASAGINNENVCRKVLEGYIDNETEGNLYAKNILAKNNRGLKTGSFQSGIMRDLSAASIVALKDGNVFYTKVRHDYVKKITNHFFRFLT